MTTSNAVIAECRLRDRDLQAEWCARRVADQLVDAMACADRVSLAVSGGRTPRTFLRRLAERPLDWSRVVVTLVDERWVDPASDDSNERLVREHLLRAEAAKAGFVPMKNAAPTPADGVDDLEAAFADVPWPLTVAVLGMGDDGHTASLFPGADGLGAGLDPAQKARVVAIGPHGVPQPRMSLSLAALAAARHLLLMIAGDEKWRVYREALAALDANAVADMPVRAVLAQDHAPVEVFWAP